MEVDETRKVMKTKQEGNEKETKKEMEERKKSFRTH